MRRKGITTYSLIKDYSFSKGTLDSLKQNRNISTATLNDLCEKGLSGYRSQFELITAVGGSADGVSRFHLPAALTDDIDYVRAAALRKLVPYSLVDLFLREEPARVLGHIHGPYHAFFLFGVPARPPDNPRPTHGVFS